MSARSPVDAPYDRLQPLPRALWLPAIVCSAGERAQRLADVAAWLAALRQDGLPAPGCDFGDAAAMAPLRQAVGELGLPALCRATPALAEQVLRTLLSHLDCIVDHQPRCTREAAIAATAAAFRAEWTEQAAGLEADLALLRDLGDFGHLQWDTLQGRLRSRPWQAVRQAAQRLQQMPALAALIRRLGRSEHRPEGDAAAAVQPLPGRKRRPLRALETRLPDAPGEITGIRFTARPEKMLASEAAMLRHPVLRKLWRARHAEARLLGWHSEARLVDWRLDAQAPLHALEHAAPRPQERGPILLALDTSGSMKGAPERVAKAVVVAALMAAHAAGRGCRLIAFGAAGEVLERDLGRGADGLDALLALMDQSFDGGTDVQTPVERAIAAVHEAAWQAADLLVVSDGEFGCMPATLASLDDARRRHGLRVQGVLVGDRETLGLLELCDDIHAMRDWRRHLEGEAAPPAFSPVHSQSLTALYFPNALSPRARRQTP